MRVEKDFKEFIALLNKNNVRYLITGGFAYSFYAEPRFTRDIDILIDSTEANAERVLSAIQGFGFTDIDLGTQDFLESGQVIQLGIAPLRIDLLTSIKGILFSEAWKKRTTGQYGDIQVFFISKEDLIKSKKASGRKQDLVDAEKLEKI
jgi:hypothetical protein